MEMKLDLVYATTREDLDNQIENRLADGWLTASEVLTVRPPNLDKEIPHFVYYVQIITREKPARSKTARE
jgi:hypothetical protein